MKHTLYNIAAILLLMCFSATGTKAQMSITADKAPVIDYQMGALRDDFDFGSVLVFC